MLQLSRRPRCSAIGGDIDLCINPADEGPRVRIHFPPALSLRTVRPSGADIAKIVGCAPKTLRKRFRVELDRGVAEANAMISGSLFTADKAGNITAMIFWLKTRAHWRERPPADSPLPGSDSGVVLVLPDNNHDPDLTQILRNAQDSRYVPFRQTRE